jgi:hypothetical protein
VHLYQMPYFDWKRGVVNIYVGGVSDPFPAEKYE